MDVPGPFRVRAWAGDRLVGDDWAVVTGDASARVVDLATGAAGGTVDLGPDVAVPAVMATGDGDLLVGATTTADGVPALVVLGIAHRRDGVPDITLSETIVLDDRTAVPTSVARAADGTVTALADRSGGDDVRLWICRRYADGCALEDPPFGDRGRAELLVD